MWSDKRNNITENDVQLSDYQVIHSIAEMENALAHLLNIKVDVLERNADRWSDEEIKSYINHLEKILKKVLLKEIVMLLLLDEKDKRPGKCPHCKKAKCECCCKTICHTSICHVDCYHKCHCDYDTHCCHKCCSKRKCSCFSW